MKEKNKIRKNEIENNLTHRHTREKPRCQNVIFFNFFAKSFSP